MWRYWQLPEDVGTLGLHRRELVEAFVAQFEQAVADRLRCRRVGVELSGGMDSTSVAAVARRLLQRSGAPFELKAQTCVYDHWIADQERRYATLVAKHLGMETDFIVGEDYRLLETAPDAMAPPEPADDLQPARSAAIARRAAAASTVWLTGWDGDALLSEPMRPHLLRLREQGRWGELALALLSFAWSSRWLVRVRWPRSAGAGEPPTAEAQAYPAWIDPALQARLGLRERWQHMQQCQRVDHPVRPYAYTVFASMAAGGRQFDGYDAGFTGQPLEYRHPMMDLRLIGFCLALPLQPWVVKKHMLRVAMKDALPPAVLRRPKSPLAGWPDPMLLQRDAQRLHHLPPIGSTTRRYVKPHADGQAAMAQQAMTAMDLRPRLLDNWLAKEAY